MSTGALNDLERVTKQAYAMVAYYGMSEAVGNLSFYDSTGQSDLALTKPYSDLTAQQIDAEARLLIDRAYKMAEKVLREHADGLKQLAELLLDREVVFTEDVERIFGKRKKDIERERAKRKPPPREPNPRSRRLRRLRNRPEKQRGNRRTKRRSLPAGGARPKSPRRPKLPRRSKRPERPGPLPQQRTASPSGGGVPRAPRAPRTPRVPEPPIPNSRNSLSTRPNL